jgi:hypothetical protein
MSTISEKIKQRRLQLWVHSCIYYKLNQNIIDDATWNKWSEELVELQEKYLEESKNTEYYEIFSDWDGSTGAFLPLDDEWVVNKAHQLLNLKYPKPVVKQEPKQVKPKSSASLLF